MPGRGLGRRLSVLLADMSKNVGQSIRFQVRPQMIGGTINDMSAENANNPGLGRRQSSIFWPVDKSSHEVKQPAVNKKCTIIKTQVCNIKKLNIIKKKFNKIYNLEHNGTTTKKLSKN